MGDYPNNPGEMVSVKVVRQYPLSNWSPQVVSARFSGESEIRQREEKSDVAPRFCVLASRRVETVDF